MAPRNCKSHIEYGRKSTVEDLHLCPLFVCLFLSAPAGRRGASLQLWWNRSHQTGRSGAVVVDESETVSEDLIAVCSLGQSREGGARATVASEQ